MQVEDTACSKFEGMVELCSQVEIVSYGVVADAKTGSDLCVAKAFQELRQDGVFKHPCDYAYIMIAANEETIKGMRFFYSPKEYIDYMRQLEIDTIPGRTTIYDAIARTCGRYPNWIFTDHPSETEILRRKNVVRRFSSAFMRAKLRVSDCYSDNR